MHLATIFVPLALTIASALPAQTEMLRGKVEDVPNTQNQFFLDCTNIPMQSAVIDLNTIVGQQSILQVVNIGTAQNPRLDVLSATPTLKVFDMGNLRINQSARWQVNAAPGSFSIVFLNFTANTAWTPFGSAGVWLLGTSPAALNSGLTNAMGQFEFNYAVPNVPGLVGTDFSAQALVGQMAGGLVTWFFSNPDCKTLEAR